MYGTVQTELTVIFLLTVLDLFLLGSVLMQCHQSRDYARTTQTQILVYLERNGIEVQQETIPWESGLSARREGAGRPDSSGQ